MGKFITKVGQYRREEIVNRGLGTANERQLQPTF